MKIEVPPDSYAKLVDNKLFFVVGFTRLLAWLQLDKAEFVAALTSKLAEKERDPTSVYKDLRSGNPVKNAEAKAARDTLLSFITDNSPLAAVEHIKNEGLIQPAFFVLPFFRTTIETFQIKKTDFQKKYNYHNDFIMDIEDGRRVVLSLALDVVRSLNKELEKNQQSLSPIQEITSDPLIGRRTAARKAVVSLSVYRRWPPDDGHDLRSEDQPSYPIVDRSTYQAAKV